MPSLTRYWNKDTLLGRIIKIASQKEKEELPESVAN